MAESKRGRTPSRLLLSQYTTLIRKIFLKWTRQYRFCLCTWVNKKGRIFWSVNAGRVLYFPTPRPVKSPWCEIESNELLLFCHRTSWICGIDVRRILILDSGEFSPVALCLRNSWRSLVSAVIVSSFILVNVCLFLKSCCSLISVFTDLTKDATELKINAYPNWKRKKNTHLYRERDTAHWNEII